MATFLEMIWGSARTTVRALSQEPRHRRVTVLVLFLSTLCVTTPVRGQTFSSGDIFAAMGGGVINWYDLNGSPKGTIVGTGGLSGMRHHPVSGQLWVTNFFGATGSVSFVNTNGITVGSANTPFQTDPESVVFDAAGNAYVGGPGGQLVKLSATGAFLDSYVLQGEATQGPDWIDLCDDQHTIFYTSEGAHVKRYDVATQTQLPDFADLSAICSKLFAIRLLPDGSLLVAGVCGEVYRLNGSGAVIKTYIPTNPSGFFALALPPGAQEFWAGGLAPNGPLYKFDIATGNVLASFTTGLAGQDVHGIAVFGDDVIGVCNVSGTPEACCLPTGCQMLDPQSCIAAGGTPMGPGTQCTAPQACCFRGGGCAMMDPLCCVFQATGTPAGPACLGDINGDGINDGCVPCTHPPAGMVAWWPLDEQAGVTTVEDIAFPTTAFPASVFKDDGAPQPGPIGNLGPDPVPGAVDGALRFFGTYVEVPKSGDINLGASDFSIDAWIKVTSVQSAEFPLVDKYYTVDNTGFVLGYDFNFGRGLFLDINGSPFYSNSGPPFPVTFDWTHVAVTVRRNPALGIFYVNGAPTGPQFAPPTGSVTNFLPLWIGKSRKYSSGADFQVDELEIFNRVLAAGEVKDVFDAGGAGKCKINPGQKSIPTLSEWGAIIFGALLTAGVAIYIWRRRKLATDAA